MLCFLRFLATFNPCHDGQTSHPPSGSSVRHGMGAQR
jgi:hypothetical protein